LHPELLGRKHTPVGFVRLKPPFDVYARLSV